MQHQLHGFLCPIWPSWRFPSAFCWVEILQTQNLSQIQNLPVKNFISINAFFFSESSSFPQHKKGGENNIFTPQKKWQIQKFTYYPLCTIAMNSSQIDFPLRVHSLNDEITNLINRWCTHRAQKNMTILMQAWLVSFAQAPQGTSENCGIVCDPQVSRGSFGFELVTANRAMQLAWSTLGHAPTDRHVFCGLRRLQIAKKKKTFVYM